MRPVATVAGGGADSGWTGYGQAEGVLMREARHDRWIGGLLVGLSLLAACGGGTSATTTSAPLAATVATRATGIATGGVPGTAVRRTPSPAAGTATRSRPATAGTRTPVPQGTARAAETPGILGTAIDPVAPDQAYRNLQALDNYRLTLFADDLSDADVATKIVYEYNQSNQRMIATAPNNAEVLEAYRIGTRVSVRVPPATNFLEVGEADLVAPLVASLFELPGALLANITQAGAQYTPAGTEMVNGRAAVKYSGSVALLDLGFLDPSLQGQRGTSETTIWVASDRGIVVAAEAVVKQEASDSAMYALRLDITDVGQVGPLAVPR